MKKIAWIATLIIFIIFPKPTLATRSLHITSDRSSLKGYEEAIVTASSSGFVDGETIYIKGAFSESGCTSCNYFGYTKNGDGWIKNSDSILSQKQVKIGEWDGSLVVKSDFSDSGYKGEGEYKFKVGFYYLTSSGNPSSINWSADLIGFSINDPDPTPTNTPTLTSSPTTTNTPSQTPTAKITATNTPAPTIKNNLSPSNISSKGAVLGEKIIRVSSVSSKITPAKKVERQEQGGKNNIAIILISIGLIFVIICVILWFLIYKKKILKTNGK
jgi:hypothetical protein